MFGNSNCQLVSGPVRPDCIATFTFWLCVWQWQLSTGISPSQAEALRQCKAGLLVWSRCPRRGKLHFQLVSRHSLPLCLATAIVNWNLAQSGLTASPLSLSGAVFGNGNCQLESRPVRPRLYRNVRQACWSGAGAPTDENCIFNWIFATLCFCVWQRQLTTGISPSQA